MHVLKQDHEICNCIEEKNVFHHEDIAYQNQRML